MTAKDRVPFLSRCHTARRDVSGHKAPRLMTRLSVAVAGPGCTG